MEKLENLSNTVHCTVYSTVMNPEEKNRTGKIVRKIIGAVYWI